MQLSDQTLSFDRIAVQRNIILSLLLTLTVLAWAALFWQRASAGADMAMTSP
jgi:hypothetical protein